MNERTETIVQIGGLRYEVVSATEAYVQKHRRSGPPGGLTTYRQRITSAPKLRRLWKLAQAEAAAGVAPELDSVPVLSEGSESSPEVGEKPEGVKMRKSRTVSRVRTEVGPRPGTKLAKIVGMLKRPTGCTAAEVMKACKWPSVSMPQQAKAAGLRLKKEKVHGVTRYRAAS